MSKYYPGKTELPSGVSVWNQELNGVQRVGQRINVCNCGCHGQDSWHATNLKRIVRNVVFLDALEDDYGWSEQSPVKVCARGEYKHPSGDMRRAGLYVAHGQAINWIWLPR